MGMLEGYPVQSASNEIDADQAASKVVLVIEDSELDAEIIKNIVQSKGSTAFVASSYELATQMTNALKFSALTVDVNLAQDLTGPQMVESLQLVGQGAVETPKVVVLTGSRLSDDEVSHYKQRGFTDVLFKPIDKDRLLQGLGL